MRISVFHVVGTEPERVLDFRRANHRILIGRNTANDIVLDSLFVAGEAAVLVRRPTGWELDALALSGIRVGERDLRGGDKFLIDRSQTVTIYPYSLKLELPDDRPLSAEAIRGTIDGQMVVFLRQVHLDLLERMGVSGEAETRNPTDEYLSKLEVELGEIAKARGLLEPGFSIVVDHMAGHCLRSELLSRLLESLTDQVSDVWNTTRRWMRSFSAVPSLEQEFESILRFTSTRLGLEKSATVTARADLVESLFWNVWQDLARQQQDEIKRYLALRYLKKEIKDIAFGYGPLEDLLRSPLISEIMVVDREHIYVERNGVLENSGRRFVSDETTRAIIERIVTKVGRRIDKSKPLVDARLTDGSRVNAVIPPLAINGPCLTVRKFPLRKLLIDDLIKRGSLTPVVAEFLRAAVLNRCNILVSGGTGTGKTTLLNCLSDFIPDKERIITIEDTAELQLMKEHVVRLEAKQQNIEGAGAFTICDLVRNALRMRPDRIIVGECRGAEALDMLQAMNTGHDGSLTTIHANSSADVILRLEVLVQMAAALPLASIHRQIVSAIDLVVQLVRMRDGRRMISEISEIVGIDSQTGSLTLRELYHLDEKNESVSLVPTGRLPTFMPELIERDLLKLETFYL